MDEREEAVVISLSKAKLLMMTLGAAAFVAGGAWLVVLARDHSGLEALFLYIAGIAAMLFFGSIAPLTLTKLFSRHPGLIISREGLYDNSSGVAAGLIPWGEIEGFSVSSVHSQRFLTVYVVNPQKYVGRGNVIQRFFNSANNGSYGSPIHISSNTLKANFDDLVQILHRWQESHRNAG